MVHDPNDKGWWVLRGEQLEQEFLKTIAPHIDATVILNPDKLTNPKAPDFLFNGKVCDLKSQQTPFFRAGEIYGVSPSYAVTFNHKSYYEYKKKYPKILVLFWINWKELSRSIGTTEIQVKPINAVWVATLPEIEREGKKHPGHYYATRKFSANGNAKSSMILDVRKFKLIYTGTTDA